MVMDYTTNVAVRKRCDELSTKVKRVLRVLIEFSKLLACFCPVSSLPGHVSLESWQYLLEVCSSSTA